MAKFDNPLYVDPHGRNVMVGGKPAEQRIGDLEEGFARVGGFWRHPNYFEAYLYSASILIEQGRASGSLDEVGLPGFYLQRHAVELLMKGLLGWLVDIADLRRKLWISNAEPSKELIEDLRRCHNLHLLHKHLLDFGAVLSLPSPPAELGELIDDMKEIEITDTWSRYSSSSKRIGGVWVGVQHIPKEVVIPIVEFQERLGKISALVASREAFGGSYEDRLYEVWAELSAALDQ